MQFWLNGQPQGATVSATVYQMDDLERGSHQISAQIQDLQGRTLISLKPITVHVQRHFKRK
ncbi:MAG: hypothetical protein P8P12_07105 [Porticoccaceae bacterium]|nr:hypothetical protein [Porticoccaceae bacterium]